MDRILIIKSTRVYMW